MTLSDLTVRNLSDSHNSEDITRISYNMFITRELKSVHGL